MEARRSIEQYVAFTWVDFIGIVRPLWVIHSLGMRAARARLKRQVTDTAHADTDGVQSTGFE